MNAAPTYPLASDIASSAVLRSGILQLRNRTETYFREYNVAATVAPVGLRYRTFTLNQNEPSNANRVVFIPGVFDGSAEPKPRSYGELSKTQRQHASPINPKEIMSWDRPITISVWSAPTLDAPREEGANIALAENLLEEVVRAIHTVGRADITWGAIDINASPGENSFGVELLVHITQRGPLYGITHDVLQPKAAAPTDHVRTT